MRDDFQIPNLGEAPPSYDVRFFSRMVRNIELTLNTIRSNGKIGASLLALEPTTVAGLPSRARPGWVAYTSDGRKPGEGAGAGTGILVFYDGVAWRTPSGTTVSA